MIKILLMIGLIYLLATLFLYVKQRDLMYFPTPEVKADAEIWWLQTSSEKLKIWKLDNATHENSPAIIYFGGNAEQVENNIPDYRWMFKDYSVYITNYRGFGGSTGTPSEQNLFDDALAIFDQVLEKHQQINIIGRSLGSGVACFVAANRPVNKLALITPYDSIVNVAQSAYPIFPVKKLIKDNYDSIGISQDIHSDILILVANGDAVVPNNGTDKLIKAFAHNSVKVERYSNTTHAQVSDLANYKQALSAFFTAP